MLKICLICGGPSKERDISLNSVRSVYDHISTIKNIKLTVVFIDENKVNYLIDKKFLYSNTTSDFSFNLSENEKKTNGQFIDLLKNSDIVFPVMHGKYGEDGGIQYFLESNKIPHIASSSQSCIKMYNKKNADQQILQVNKMATIPKLFLSNNSDMEEKIKVFITTNNLQSVVIKPVEGGSSIGVQRADGINDIIRKATESLTDFGDIVIEKLCEGREFTIIILENEGKPVALIPTEIELLDQNKKPIKGEIFDQRRKYLSTTETRYHCPANFDESIILKIRQEAEYLFKIVGANDFLRIDGWLLNDNTIYFSDFNPISGMEQNSFIFQQAAKAGFRHRDLLEYIIQNACKRYNIPFSAENNKNINKKRLNVIMGGTTSERQVSIMSGTNAWLKLSNSDKFLPFPYILFCEEDKIDEYMVCEIPYAAALSHTTEEILGQIKASEKTKNLTTALRTKILSDLAAASFARCPEASPLKMTLPEFISFSKEEDADIFIGLHGGFGENGSLQKILEDQGVHFNGSGSQASQLCMDKYRTGELINNLHSSIICSCKKKKYSKDELFRLQSNLSNEWKNITNFLGGSSFIIKPNGDGCSTGIVIIDSIAKLERYLVLYFSDVSDIPENTFVEQPKKVQLPNPREDVLFEEYIETKKFEFKNKNIISDSKPWVELTVGVLEKNGVYHSLNPSITVADGVLSMEDKFQGGTGINLTPPPDDIISGNVVKSIKEQVKIVAQKCGIKDYCRIDIFVNNDTGKIIIIELNTLPGLSPSTVLFQQGTAELPPVYPIELLEKIITH